MDRKLKVCVFTGARSEYGLLLWIITDMERDPDIELQLIAGGGHLSPDQGMTVRQIEADGHHIDRRIEFLLSTATDTGIAKSTGMCAISLADALSELRPDVLLVLGDRYELLAVCSVALILNIPIAHISGGDITEGAIDNQIRDAVTMMADLHLPCTEPSAERVRTITEGRKPVVNVGEPGLETFVRTAPMSRAELAADLGLDPDRRWILCTIHTETKATMETSMAMARNTIEALAELPGTEVVITAANADAGGAELNDYYRKVCDGNLMFRFIHSLGHRRYLSMMRQAYALVGNTSSGILETPFVGVPTVNIGVRQKGRHLCANVITPRGISKEDIAEALTLIPDTHYPSDSYFGDGHSAQRVIAEIKARYL